MGIFNGPGNNGTKSNNPYNPNTWEHKAYNDAVDSRDRMKRAMGEKVPGEVFPGSNGCLNLFLFCFFSVLAIIITLV